MKFYLKLLIISNIVMLHVSDIFLFFNCTKIPNIIIKQCKINGQYIEEGLSNE